MGFNSGFKGLKIISQTFDSLEDVQFAGPY